MLKLQLSLPVVWDRREFLPFWGLQLKEAQGSWSNLKG